MTREEAIAILEVSKHMATSGRLYNQAVDMAMESLVQEIVGRHLEEFSDKTIKVMVDDCQFQRDMNLYGDECDKVGWLKWEQKVKDEQTIRTIGGDDE